MGRGARGERNPRPRPSPRIRASPVVVPAGVDVRAKLRLRAATVALVRQLGLDDGWPFMLLPARITKRKNIEYAIGVTRALRDLGLAPRLLVTGPPGPHNVRSVDYVDELQAERARLDVRAEVTFLYEERRPDGRLWTATDPMMDDLYQLADLLIFPSAQEGFGIPLLEAGLVRLPVFCSDIPPFREIAGDRVHRFALDAPPADTAARIAQLPGDRPRHPPPPRSAPPLLLGARLPRAHRAACSSRPIPCRDAAPASVSQRRTPGGARRCSSILTPRPGSLTEPAHRPENGAGCDDIRRADDDEYTILVPTTDLSTAGRLIQIAAALMPVHEGEARGKVLPLGVVEIPEELGFSAGAVPARMHRQMLGRLRRVNKSPQIELRTLVRVHRQVWQGIVETARDEGVDLILLGWSGRVDADSVLGTTIDEAVRNAPCDIAVAKGVSVQSAKRILVPIRGGPHAALAFKLATGLADRVDGIVTALRIERPPGPGEPDEGTIASRERDREEFEAVLATAPRPDRVREVVVEAELRGRGDPARRPRPTRSW